MASAAVTLAPPPRAIARNAGLRHATDAGPGIRRTKKGGRFAYVWPDGAPVRDEATLRRIRALAIPPAWRDVWICPAADGHIQATGRDARGRKQYRYHAEWRRARDETKFHRTMAFGEALPRLRSRVRRDLRRDGMPREKVLAIVVRLLERTFARVGNHEYRRHNGSYGLTTLRDRHVDVDGADLRLRFRGKAGKMHELRVRDRRLAGLVRACRDLPGEELFQFVDERGRRQAVTSAHVNEYLRDATGRAFSAKDFRTWAGTVLCVETLRKQEGTPTSAAARKRELDAAIRHVASRLGNTPAVCRRAYVHPAVVRAQMDGSLLSTLRDAAPALDRRKPRGLTAPEHEVLALLRAD